MSVPINRISLSKIEKISDLLVIVGSIVLVIVISAEFFGNNAFNSTNPIYRKIQFWVCVVFMVDFLINAITTNNKKRYLAHHWFLFLISIPVVSIVYYYDLRLTHEQELLLKLVPLIRGGYALAVIVRWVSHSPLTSLFVTYLTLLVGFTYFASFLFYSVERTVNPAVTNYGDALWWACMDVTTVGSEIYARTTIGRILSIILAATGMMMFPIFTAYITDKFKNRKTNATTSNSIN